MLAPLATGRCPSTCWTLIRRARDGSPEGMRAALENLLTLYLPALKAHLIYRGNVTVDQVDDAVQGFITSRILERDLLAHVDPGKGKFRTLLLTALDRYVVSIHRHDAAACRSPSHRPVDLQAAGDVAAARNDADPFEVAWARQVLAVTLDRLQREFVRTGRESLWELFERRIVRPIVEGVAPIGYEQLVREFGFASPAHARNALITARRTFARTLRDVVGEYTGDEEDATEEEVRDLRRIFSGAAAAESCAADA